MILIERRVDDREHDISCCWVGLGLDGAPGLER